MPRLAISRPALKPMRPIAMMVKLSRVDGPGSTLAPEITSSDHYGPFGRSSPILTRPTEGGATSPVFSINSATVKAQAVEVDGQMVVLAGSQSRSNEGPSLASNVRNQRRRLMESGRLIRTDQEGILVFTQDEAFTSPSAAAQAVMGTSRNGRLDWVDERGRTYGEWQEAEIAASLQQAGQQLTDL
jgi:hypothetical protein